MIFLTSNSGAHKSFQLSVVVPCVGSSVSEAGCLESFSWLWVVAHWNTVALRPPSQWPWYPETRCLPTHSEKKQSASGKMCLLICLNKAQIKPWRKIKCECYLWPIRQSGYELWCHPVWCSNQRLPSLHFFRHLCTETKVWQLHLETERDGGKEGCRQKERKETKNKSCQDYFSHTVCSMNNRMMEKYKNTPYPLYLYFFRFAKLVKNRFPDVVHLHRANLTK